MEVHLVPDSFRSCTRKTHFFWVVPLFWSTRLSRFRARKFLKTVHMVGGGNDEQHCAPQVDKRTAHPLAAALLVQDEERSLRAPPLRSTASPRRQHDVRPLICCRLSRGSVLVDLLRSSTLLSRGGAVAWDLHCSRIGDLRLLFTQVRLKSKSS